jgi:pimeloyl-ACP methyl ester carboxylesterase
MLCPSSSGGGSTWPESAPTKCAPFDFAMLLDLHFSSAKEVNDMHGASADSTPRGLPSRRTQWSPKEALLKAPTPHLSKAQANLCSPQLSGDASNQAVAPNLPPNAKRPASTKTPVTFLHGVGLGMLPYLAFLWAILRAFRGHPVLAIEVRHVSLRLCGQARAIDDVACAVAAMLRRHGVQQSHFAAHSFGTFVLAHLRHLYPDVVASMLLCDPVCSPPTICLFMLRR